MEGQSTRNSTFPNYAHLNIMTNSNEILRNILEHFHLTTHPEGGAYLETYRSHLSGTFYNFKDKRSASTGIYFLLKENEFSAFHRIKSDEMWHFYLGGPLEIIEIDLHGKVITTILGQDFTNGEKLQYVVSAGHWFASKPLKGSQFSFVGCTVAPGFDFKDFELAKRENLILNFPIHNDIISELTNT